MSQDTPGFDVSRRGFLAWLSAAGAALAGLSGCGDSGGTPPRENPAAPPTPQTTDPDAKLNAEERRTIQTVANHLIPADDSPGAESLDIGAVLDRECRGNAEFEEFLHRGTARCNTVAARLYKGTEGFAELEPGQQQYILRAFFDRAEDPEVVASHDSDQLFYHWLLQVFDATRGAFYSSDAGYAMLGYTEPILGHADYMNPPEPR